MIAHYLLFAAGLYGLGLTPMVFVFRVQVALMVAHYMLFAAGLYASGASLASGLAFYCTGYAWQGIYLGFFFGLSHFAAERVPSTAT